MPLLVIPSKDILEHVLTGVWMDQGEPHNTGSDYNLEILPMFIDRNLRK